VKAAAATDKAVSYTFSLYYTPKDQDPVVLNANLVLSVTTAFLRAAISVAKSTSDNFLLTVRAVIS